MTDRRRIEYGIGVNDQQFTTGTKNVVGRLKDMAGGFGMTDGMIRGATNAMGAFGLVMGGRQLLSYAGDAIQLAVGAEEVRSKFEAVYGPANDFKRILSEWGDVAGVTDTKAFDLAATFGNLAIAQGISKDETMVLAEKVADLAGDMGSFNDANPEDVFYDINKAMLTTEREGMKKYGISVGENEVKTRAMELAVADGRDAVTDADRALASYEIIVRQAGMANGDLERTADSAANKQRQLKADTQELQEEIGQKLLPIYEDLLDVAVVLAPAMDAVAVAVGAVTTPITGASDAIKIARDDSKGWWEKLNDLNSAALNIVSPMGGAEQAFKDVASEGKNMAKETGLAGEKSDEVSKGALARLKLKLEENRDRLYELAEAQTAYRKSVESDFVQAARTQDQWLEILNAKYRIMQGWDSPWSKWGPPPAYYGDSQYNPGPSSGQQSSSNQSEWNSINGGPV